MLHAVVWAYILCLALGLTLVVVSLLVGRRLSSIGLQDFALLFAAATLVLLVEALKTYERAVGGDFGPALHLAAIALATAGNAGMGWYMPSLAFLIVRRPAEDWRLGFAILAAALGAIGGMTEASPLIWDDRLQSLLWWNADYLSLLGLHVAVWGLLLKGLPRVEDRRLQGIVRAFLIYLAVFAVLAVPQLIGRDIPSTPAAFRNYPLDQLLYYLGFAVTGLVLLVGLFARPPGGSSGPLPPEFCRRFRISNREEEIIGMMAQGLSNRTIADRLFISSRTVKNHVYHIYQKTGAGNKIQLLNLMNSMK